jgi:RimJ/RimL family protein N-acetyltransferase
VERADVTPDPWAAVPVLETDRLVLEPLRVEHAEEMAPVLADETLHEFMGGRPESVDELRARYRRQARGVSDDGDERWFNWVLRRRDTRALAGTVQATVLRDGDRVIAEVAWVVGIEHQRQGLAREAAVAMALWLRSEGATVLVAHVHPDHDASAGVARALGLQPTDVVEDSETRWES